MSRNVIIKLIALLSICIITSCSENEQDMTKHLDLNVSIFTDPETNVQYIVYGTLYGVGITPRLNIDGTLYIEE